jgi:ABC-2 type transport system ATP-binding protein
MESMDKVILVNGLTKRFRKHTAVEDLSFDVPRGSVFAMLGNNGAGKTTTIRSLVGLEEPSAGEIEVLGLDPRRDSVAIRRRVGYVPEERNLYEWMTPVEIGWFVGKFYPTWSAERFSAILKHFELPTDRKIGKLSRGMKAQLDLSLALAHEPELLVLDEPTGGLDSLVRRDFLESMIAVAGQGRTVLVSSHEVREVERVADRGLILFNSKLLWCGEIDDLKANTAEVLFPPGAGYRGQQGTLHENALANGSV